MFHTDGRTDGRTGRQAGRQAATGGQTDRQTDRQTDMPKPIFAFRNTANAPKNELNSNFENYFDLCLYARKGTLLLDKSIQI